MSITPLEGAEAIQLQGDVPDTSISLYDEFKDPNGRFLNYATYDNGDQTAILNQSHIDIRTFNQAGIHTDWEMAWLDTERMNQLDGIPLSTLEGRRLIQTGESWTNGAVGPVASLNYWNALQLACPGGLTTTSQSITTDLNSGRVNRVNLKDGFQDTDVISIALPNFPLSNIDTANSFVDFTSSNDGALDLDDLLLSPQTLLGPNTLLGGTMGRPIDSIAFSQSVTSLTNGHSELSFPRSLLASIDISQVTGVRFRIAATGDCTLTVAAIRLLGPNWRYANYDIDTLWGGLRPPVSRTGDPAVTSYTMPVVWKSTVPSSVADPQPVDASVAISFNTGHISSTETIDLYFRERATDELVQSSLNLLTQSGLDGYVQPDYGSDSIVGTTMTDIELYDQSYLTGQSQYDLETKPNSAHGSWIRVRLTYTSTEVTLDIRNTLGNGYTLPITTRLSSNTDYIMIATIKDTCCRVEIYPLNISGHILVQQAVFDTGWIYDSFLFKRRAGRFGWQATLSDGDAVIYNIRNRYLNFGEIKTKRLESITPVAGVSIQAEGHTSRELFTGWSVGPFGGTLDLEPPGDPSVHQILKITNTGMDPYQGIMSNEFYVENFDSTEISLDILFPRASQNAPLKMFLLGERQRQISLPLIITQFGQWQHIFIHAITNELAQTGPYRLCIVQPTTNTPTIWRVDNTSIRERTIEWASRVANTDAWGDIPAPWVNFYNMVNDSHKGILFDKRDRFLQVRGRLLRQDAYFTNLTVTPKYAELGRFVWTDTIEPAAPPIPQMYVSVSGFTVTLDASGSSDLNGKIINYAWNFGDGTVNYGEIVEHTYASHGVYSITLTLTNDLGTISYLTEAVVV